jgi:CubicO group peptidase (beta-lactamase class C family)
VKQASTRKRNDAPPTQVPGVSNVQGEYDPSFALAVRSFAAMFPHRRFGGGALAVYLDGEPVVDVWTGWSDRSGEQRWTADTGAMVFSATKGVASTVIHRLADRGLIDYDVPVAEYWPEFGAAGKQDITVRELLRHRAGLSHLDGVRREDVLDHIAMEARMAAQAPSGLRGKPAYHAVTYGWLVSGLARAVTGKGMRQLFREEIAAPLNVDGIHLGRPPATSPTHAAQTIHPQLNIQNPIFNAVAPHLAKSALTAGFGALYFPGMKSVIQGDMPFLDSEIPAANGVATARSLARMYGALANRGRLDGRQYLSADRTAGLSGRPSLRPDRSVIMPLAFHLGYHALPIPHVLPGYGHVGLGGSLGWAIPEAGLAIAFVHNRLLTPFVVTDQAGFVGMAALVRHGAAQARSNGFTRITDLGASYGNAVAAVG